MKRVFIIGGITLVVIVAILAAIGAYLRSSTKSHSPFEVAILNEGEVNIEVSYCRPYKKGRVIFGDLVPYNEVWRTGANEPTVFETTSDITVKGEVLSKGKYSLWTKPGETEWHVIFNSEIPNWGVDYSNKALRNPDTDVLEVTVPSYNNEKVIEQFTIMFDKMDEQVEMVIMWDKTTVVLPMDL